MNNLKKTGAQLEEQSKEQFKNVLDAINKQKENATYVTNVHLNYDGDTVAATAYIDGVGEVCPPLEQVFEAIATGELVPNGTLIEDATISLLFTTPN